MRSQSLAGIRSTAQLWQRGVIGLDAESLGGLVHEVDRLEEIVHGCSSSRAMLKTWSLVT